MVRMFEKEPAAMSPHVEEMARLVIAEGGSTWQVNNIIQFHLKHDKGKINTFDPRKSFDDIICSRWCRKKESKAFCAHLQDVLGLEASWMLELASPDPQRLLTLPLKVIVVRHQVDVRHRDVVLLGDWAGGKPGEPADGQIWLGRDGSKGGISLWEGRGAA